MSLIIERQIHASICDHTDPRRCHAKVDRYGTPYHERYAWHIWDAERDDYAAGTGPAEFSRRRDALAWIAVNASRGAS